MISALETHAKGRGLLVGAALLVAGVARFGAEAPPERTIEGVAAMLGRAAGGSVAPDDFLWEERGGFLHDAFVGRRVLFLAARPDAATGQGRAPRDLYRARVRLTRAGRPIAVSDVVNLTRTPLGDDGDLTGAGHRVAFTTATPEGVQGVTLLDLSGAPPALGFAAKARALADRWLVSGSAAGIGRTEIAFSRPPTEVKIEVADAGLVMALGSDAAPAALDFASGALQTGRENAFGASAQSGLGAPLDAALAPRGWLTAALARWVSPAAIDRRARAAAPEAAPPEGLRVGADYPRDGGWPPEPLAPVSAKPFDGEGFWHVPKAIQGPEQQVAPPPMLETVIRPDAANPDALLFAVAFDTRRLDLTIAPGTASPRPLTGPRGSGRLPGGAAASRVAAAFVAGPIAPLAPLTSDGAPREPGFVGEGRVLVPLVTGAPSLAVRPDGRAVVGAWPEDATRDAFTAIVQGPDALGAVSAAAAAPAAAPGDAARSGPAAPDARTARSALCRTAAGFLVYTFSPAATASTLAAGSKLLGCAAAVHLASGAAPMGLAFVKGAAGADGATTYSGSLAWDAMSMPIDALAGPWLEPIGVVTSRDAAPTQLGKKPIAWAPDAGTQPAPTWLPAVFSFETEELGAKVTLRAILPERATFRLAVGTDEGSVPKSAQRSGPAEAERTSALAALGLSVARRGAKRGLVLAGTELVKPSRGAAWLVLDGPRVRITGAAEPLPAGADATELPLTADEGKLLPASREVGTQRPRTAMCALADGTVLVAHTTFDTDEATTEVLLDAGCERVVALDRGAHDGVFLHRAGGERAPEASYESTTLFLLPAPAGGTARDLR